MTTETHTKSISIVMGVIGSDIHVVGNKIIHFALREAGYRVANLGIFTSQEDFIDAAKESDAHVILVCSMYGHAELDCKGLKERCMEAGLKEVKLYVGGNLMVGKHEFDEVQTVFLGLGFDRVFGPTSSPEDILISLEEDFGGKG